MSDTVMVIECQSCQSRFRLATSLFKDSRAIRVRCRKCGGYIVVENPDLAETGAAPAPSRPLPRVVPAPPPEKPPERERETSAKPPTEMPEGETQPEESGEAGAAQALAESPRAEISPPTPEAPRMDDTTRAMADLLREIDESVPPAPEAPPAGPRLPPEPAYRGPVRVTPYPEPPDGSEALASVLEDLFKPGGAAASPAEASQAEPAGGPEPKASFPPREPSRGDRKAHSARAPFSGPVLLLIVAFWLLLLAGAALLFGTDYFDRWLSGGNASGKAGAAGEKSPGPPIYEIRNVNWFSDNSYEGGALFAVTGSVTLRGKDVVDGIRVSATILGRDNVVLGEKTVFAGNFLDNTTLHHTKPEVVDSFLSRGVEDGGKREIREGETLPFMAVFFDPPEKVHSVTVKPVYTVK